MHLFSEAPAIGADVAKREIEGLVVPFDQVGQTSAGLFTYTAGSLSWAKQVGRVKVLVEHDQKNSIGSASELVEVDAAEADRRLVALGREPLATAGVWARFRIPASDEGDRALAEAADGRRDGFSVGVQMDANTEQAARRTRDGKPVKASGVIRECSLVSVPAFDSARVGSAANTNSLVVAAWHDELTTEGNAMPADDTSTTTTEELATASVPTGEQIAAYLGLTTTTNSEGATTLTQTSAGGPVVVNAAAGASVTSEPAVYTFDGSGPSFVRDAWHAKQNGDRDAADRLQRFQAAMTTGDASQTMALAAVFMRTGNDEIIPAQYKPNLLIDVIDKGRPLWTRAGLRVTLTDATPFTIPVIGDFDGVAAHTEGTAHVTEGTQALDKRTVTPQAMSGAFRVSREMIDAANPAIDRIVVAGMMRDYRRATEALVWAAIVAADATASASINTVAELRAKLIAFMATNSDIGADFVAASGTAFATLAAETATDGRPQLPFVGPTNAVGSIRAGYTGASIDGVEIANVSSVAATEMVAVRSDALLVGEGKVQTFRFDEVEGPGVIKFALWAYCVSTVVDATGVERYTTA